MAKNLKKLNSGKLKKNLKTLEKFPDNYCTNGINSKKLSHKEYLKAFALGRCNPIMIVPGLISTRLSVKIDCKVLQKRSPKVFKTCGWNTCNPSIWVNKFL